PFVTRYIAGDLAEPIVPVRLRHACAPRAVMPMPEAAMDKNGLFPPDIGDVGIAGNVLAMKAIAGPDAPSELSDDEFGFGVARAHRPHDRGAVSRRRLRLLYVQPSHCRQAPQSVVPQASSAVWS